MGRAAGVRVLALVALAACGGDSTPLSLTSGDDPATSTAEETSTTVVQNQPMTVVVEASATEVRLGEPVVFRVTATDPDAVVAPGCNSYHWFGDEEARYGGCTAGCGVMDYQEVPPEPGELTETFTHVYLTPGTFEATIHYNNHRPCDEGFRFGNESEATATVSVLPIS